MDKAVHFPGRRSSHSNGTGWCVAWYKGTGSPGVPRLSQYDMSRCNWASYTRRCEREILVITYIRTVKFLHVSVNKTTDHSPHFSDVRITEIPRAGYSLKFAQVIFPSSRLYSRP